MKPATVYAPGVTVEVITAPQSIDSFSAAPQSITEQQTSTLTWQTSNATTVKLDGATVAAAGSLVVSPPVGQTTYTLVASGAVADVLRSVTVTVTAVQQPAALAPTISGATNSWRFPSGPADWVDLNKLPPLEQPLPAAFYADPANKIIAPSQNGATVTTGWKRITLYGSNQGLYSGTPILQNGKIRQYTPYQGDYHASKLPLMAANYPNNGPRGVGLFDAYVGLHSHPTLKPDGTAIPNSPAFLGIRLDGSVMRYMLDGSIYVLGFVPGTKGPFDFSYFAPKRQLFFVADTHNGRIIRVDRLAAIAARPPGGTEDGDLWTFSDLVTGRGEITSVRCLDDGTLFWADNTAGQIWRAKMTPDGQLDGTPVKLCDYAGIFWLDYTSTQQLVAARAAGANFIDPSTGTIGALIGGSGGAGPFITVAVDRHGTCGPVDTIYWTSEHGRSNVDFKTFFPPYTAATVWYPPFGNGRAKAGPSKICDEAGHYPWVSEPGWDQAIVLQQGESDGAPSICRPYRAGEVDAPFDSSLYDAGWRYHITGSDIPGQEGTKPPLTSLMHKYGGGCLGVNHDYIGRMTFAEFDAFLAKGMIGSFPRDFTPFGKKALAYFYYWNSLQHQIEGKPLIDRLQAYYGNPTPPATLPAVPSYMDVVYAKVSGGNIVLGCYRDISNTPVAIPAGATLTVLIDEGMPNEITVATFNTVAGGIYSVPMPAVGPGQHAISVRATGLPATCSTRTVIV